MKLASSRLLVLIFLLAASAVGSAADDHWLTAGRTWVLPGERAPSGYGRYSYLLLADMNVDGTSDLNAALLSGYHLLEPLQSYESGGLTRHELNAVAIPLRVAPPTDSPSVEWLLDNYDFLSAETIRRAIGGLDPAAPYVVSASRPLAADGSVMSGDIAVRNVAYGVGSFLEFVGAFLELEAAGFGSEANGGWQAVPEIAYPAARNGGGPRLTGREFLRSGTSEQTGYGLYSYLLFSERASANSLPLYAAILDAYLRVETVGHFLEEEVSPGQLNVFYLPMEEVPSGDSSIGWLLEKYDYARAQVLLAKLGRGLEGGPYIVSYEQPLLGTTPIDPQRLLVQDLSAVPSDLAFLWVKEFLIQVSKPQYWNTSTLRNFLLQLRTGIAVFAGGFAEVRSAHADVSSFLEEKIRMQE